jgi:hypothetical protein
VVEGQAQRSHGNLPKGKVLIPEDEKMKSPALSEIFLRKENKK